MTAATIADDLHSAKCHLNMWGGRGEQFFTSLTSQAGVEELKCCIAEGNAGLTGHGNDRGR